MSEDPEKQHEIKFRVSTRERAAIDAARDAAGDPTRAQFVRRAVLKTSASAAHSSTLDRIEELVGDLGLSVNRLVVEGTESTPLTRSEAKQLAEEALRTFSTLRRRLRQVLDVEAEP